MAGEGLAMQNVVLLEPSNAAAIIGPAALAHYLPQRVCR
jgi:hypothetical protein